MIRVISRKRGGLAALKQTKLFGINDFSAAKDFGKVLIIIIYCYFIIIIVIISISISISIGISINVNIEQHYYECVHEKTFQEVIQLKTLISLRLGPNVGFGE